MDAFSERIGFLIDRFGISKLVKETGISQSQLYRLRAEDRDTTRENLIRLCDATGADLIWLATGKGSPFNAAIDPTGPGMAAAKLQETLLGKNFRASVTEKASPPLVESTDFADQYALIPLYNVSAAAGHGAVVDHEEVVDSLAFKRDWISHTLHAQPGDLYLINVQGESMTPTLHPGDVILVDRRNGENITTDGVYVIRMGDSLLVKRIQRLPGKTLRISSDNPAYQSFELKLDAANDDELSVIGRVVWSGRRM